MCFTVSLKFIDQLRRRFLDGIKSMDFRGALESPGGTSIGYGSMKDTQAASIYTTADEACLWIISNIPVFTAPKVTGNMRKLVEFKFVTV